ncbi:hypothetical protein ROZALSC1DRAFT_29562 [Rozella allomycis CSF55]|uniref:SMP-LTD domain-containing protein n=1 Tax=Rozella allomycis (strain CSF55) TaxID=988480 RepID=A0A075B359_ROZAC|nr:hypothetical protein O9G_001435 [Rozella allomycis CSF55]RKP18792.1 hypothetical protein ROZALSC1DRAFT_29562 [Rozella allomycis CSF55]|eukprot:EPZ36990.1 hypothetical protein O9G_001435 [Rozella allomycis CSF55]
MDNLEAEVYDEGQKETKIPSISLQFMLMSILIYYLGRFGFSIAYIFVCCFLLIFAYKRKERRLKTVIRVAVEKDLAIERSHNESAEWFNHLMEKFWTVYEPVLSTSIVESVNFILEDNKPNLILTEFTLGSESPRIEGVRVYPKTDGDIHLDLDVNFTPNDDEPTKRKRSFAWNSKVVLTARFGKGVVGVDIPIMLKEIYFSGKLRIQLKLMSASPFVKLIDLVFMENPQIDFVLKPLKSLDIMDVSERLERNVVAWVVQLVE